MADTRLLVRGGATALVLALAATACGGSSSSKNNASSSGSTSGTAANAIYQPSDKKGGNLQILAESDCDFWDPARDYLGICWDIDRLLFRGLMMYDAKPGAAGSKAVPDLAASDPVVTDNQKTWKYTLKDNLKFEDGTPVTSQDVKYGIERVFAQDVLSGGPIYLLEELVGGSSYKGPYKDKKGLASIETPDNKTIIFHLKRPFSDFNYLMASPQSTPVPQKKDTGAKYTFHPVANGPYKIASYTPNKSMTMVRNPNWDPATDKVRKALPDTVTMTFGLAANDIDNRIISNQGDVDFNQASGVQQAAQAKILTNPELKKRSENPTSGGLRYLVVFQKNKPFDNIHCRNAVAWVVDKKAQQLVRGGPAAGGAIATTMTPPTLKFYKPFDLFPSDGSQGNVVKAKEELKACGHPNGFNTKLAIANTGKGPKQGEALQADLKKIGINATIDAFDGATYYPAQLDVPANVHKAGFGMGLVGWNPDWPAPYGFYSSIVDGRKILPQGNSNWGELNLATVNNNIDKGLSASDDATRQAAWTAVDKAVVGSAVYIPLLFDKTLTINSERATNAYNSDGLGGYTDFVSLGVNP
jgi:peptide/nickel transport system substrate-binding protein